MEVRESSLPCGFLGARVWPQVEEKREGLWVGAEVTEAFSLLPEKQNDIKVL